MIWKIYFVFVYVCFCLLKFHLDICLYMIWFSIKWCSTLFFGMFSLLFYFYFSLYNSYCSTYNFINSSLYCVYWKCMSIILYLSYCVSTLILAFYSLLVFLLCWHLLSTFSFTALNMLSLLYSKPTSCIEKSMRCLLPS